MCSGMDVLLSNLRGGNLQSLATVRPSFLGGTQHIRGEDGSLDPVSLPRIRLSSHTPPTHIMESRHSPGEPASGVGCLETKRIPGQLVRKRVHKAGGGKDRVRNDFQARERGRNRQQLYLCSVAEPHRCCHLNSSTALWTSKGHTLQAQHRILRDQHPKKPGPHPGRTVAPMDSTSLSTPIVFAYIWTFQSLSP